MATTSVVSSPSTALISRNSELLHPEAGPPHPSTIKEVVLSFKFLLAGATLVLFASLSPCQLSPAAATPPDTTNATANAVPQSNKHIFGIIPNFRTSETLAHYEPISP